MHYIDSENRYFTKKILIETNNAAIREKRNRQLKEDFLEKLPDNKVYPILHSFDEHNRGEIRVQIIFDEKGTKGFLDLTKNRYNLLPKAAYHDNGIVKLETEELINTRRLYPEGREYVEKVGRKLLRDSSFRTKVLKAYGHQCAMCKINDDSILVAAHIYPAHLCGDDTVNNGICLCKIHDKFYEDGDICVRSNGEIFLQNKNIKLPSDRIKYPEDIADNPSPERLSQRLNLSLR
ncbi:HNH endonuclease [Heyndrickxia faecalis]|jgi:putative restriction endonuclease|uniref:HNH endonuclease n=1 Tax=Heyndrickxia faecalis TaxID=2824910 RepID=UPI003D25EC35